MLNTRTGPMVWRAAAVATVLAASMLTGCAGPTVSAAVTSFQQWPANAVGATYQFVDATPAQRNNLEYQSYRDILRASMGPTGLVEAPAGTNARFNVSFNYGSEQTQVMVRQPYDPYFYGGFGVVYGPPWWGTGFWGPSWVDVPSVAFRNRLAVEISDNERHGAEVYRASAYIVTGRSDLIRTMPYLTRAIFDNFPGNNGSEREVEFPAR
ncbi:DUF4136 domain-containing protein [Bordetella sp. 02P26C-1]|uniref:DUF4136 domain-containing protein n=1 Tax=Bordetella sp. 02P26C-1 TaxID=2683195 RepID=UPI0013542FE4|nr:DUF4136 domain-containing protein [Bordetella sp. 02P26C-1]MVW80649.1 DUF4136 domain-containing protein [Bordetella sp. 02P26C-1]